MMYQSKVVVAVKVDGKVLREFGDTVRIPFGSEYSVYIKNLQSGRIKCRVTIDGQPATNGTWLVVPSFSSVDLERFIKDGNLSAGRKLKFIERTSAIEAHRGVGAEDGLVQVEFQREIFPVFHPGYAQTPQWPHSILPWSGGSYSNSLGGGGNYNDASLTSCFNVNQASSMAEQPPSLGGERMRSLTKSARGNDAGITVGGGKSSQLFTAVGDFATGPSETVILKLVGGTDEAPVATAVLVTTKVRCQYCGKRSKSSAEYCSKCGAALHNI